MGYAIFRAEPRTISGAAAMLRHALREDVPANAVPGSPRPQLLAGVATSSQAMQRVRAAIEDARSAKKYQKTVKPVLDILVTFSHKDGTKLSENEQEQYFKKALDFVSNKFGGAENILCAAVHRDESTPHIQIIMLARDNDTKKLGCSQFMGNRGNLHKLQNEFWNECGKPYGLLRGEPRTGAKNLPVRVLYGALENGSNIPELVDVPEVSLIDKILRPEKIAIRQKIINNNNNAIESLRAIAGAKNSINPKILEQQAERYRSALARSEKAESNIRDLESRAAALNIELRRIEKKIYQKSEELERLSRDLERVRASHRRERGPEPE